MKKVKITAEYAEFADLSRTIRVQVRRGQVWDYKKIDEELCEIKRKGVRIVTDTLKLLEIADFCEWNGKSYIRL